VKAEVFDVVRGGKLYGVHEYRRTFAEAGGEGDVD
jgi:hypothetical protein